MMRGYVMEDQLRADKNDFARRNKKIRSSVDTIKLAKFTLMTTAIHSGLPRIY